MEQLGHAKMLEKITIDVLDDQPRAQVWRFYVTPDDITGWNFADPSWCCPNAAVDLRVGGRYVARMEARDQSVGFDFGGTYQRVEPQHLLEFHLDDGRVVGVIFEDHGTGTKVTCVPSSSPNMPASICSARRSPTRSM